jgi:hypothetical protein
LLRDVAVVAVVVEAGLGLSQSMRKRSADIWGRFDESVFGRNLRSKRPVF